MIILISHDPSQSGIYRYSLSLFKALNKTYGKVNLLVAPSTFMNSPSFEILKPIYGMMIYLSTRIFATALSHKKADVYHLLNSTVSGFFDLNPTILTVHDLMPFTLFKEGSRSWAKMGWAALNIVQGSMKIGICKAKRIICVS